MRQIRSDVEALARKMLAELPEAERVIAAWPLACGAKTAARATAADFADGVLRVRVEERSWREEMRPLAAQLKEHLHRLTSVRVADILFLSGAEMDRKPFVARAVPAKKSVRRKRS